MTGPLAVLLASFLTLPAAAQTRAINPEALKAELTRKFVSGEELKDLSALEPDKPLVELFKQAQYVQAGREDRDEKETYIAFIRSVARRLGVRSDRAVELYGDRVRSARSVQAAQSELDAREALAEDVRHNPGISEEKKKRLAQDLQRTSLYLKSGRDGNAEIIFDPNNKPAEIVAHAREDQREEAASYTSTGELNRSRRILPRVQPLQLITTPTPSPLQSASAGMMSWETLTSYFDWEKGKKVAMEAYTGTLNYVKAMGAKCYRFFKQALIDAGVIDAPNPQSTGLVGLRPGAAKMFSQDVKKNPKILDTMGYREVDLAHVSNDPASVPDGSLLIYAGGCSFADKTSGHSEITVGPETYTDLRTKNSHLRELMVADNELRVCHFTCTRRSMPFLRTYGKQGCLKMYVPVKSS